MSSTLCIDSTQAKQFLGCLDPTTDVFVFQTIDDNKERKSPRLSKVIVGRYDDVAPQLNWLQSQGAGVFVQVHAGQARGRSHITQGRALFFDCDAPDDVGNVREAIKQALPRPSALVISSGTGKVHGYWWVDGLSSKTIKQAQYELADVAGTDGSVTNADRVMRLPGSWHLKAEPFQVRLATCSGTRHNTAQLLDGLRGAEGRGAILPQTGKAQGYDPVFGLPWYSDGEEITELPEGNRTQALISHIGRQVAAGYSAQYIEQEVRHMCATLVPEGHSPVTEAALQQEILPAMWRFFDNQRAEQEDPDDPEPPPSGPAPTTVPGLPGYDVPPPPAPDGPVPPPAPLDLTTSPNQSLEEWENALIYVEEGQYVVDTRFPISAGVYRLSDFEKAKANVKKGQGLLVKKWLASTKRKTVRDFRFAPGEAKVFAHEGVPYVNSYDPPAMLEESQFDSDQLAPFWEHMQWLFQDVDAFERMLHWLAFTVQRPQTRVPWAPLLVSTTHGTGKSWLFECIKAMMGKRHTSAVSPAELQDNKYNAYMSQTVCVLFEEVHTRNKHETIDALKDIITNPTLEINQKFGQKGQQDIFANVFMTTNHPDALALKEEDMRRYWVYHVDRPQLSPEQSSRIYDWLKGEGPRHLYYYLMHVDLSEWAFNAHPPITAAARDMIRFNMSLVNKALHEAIEDRAGVFQCDVGDAKQLEQTVANELDQDSLDKRQKMELQHLVRRYTTELRRVNDNGRIVRLMVWRNERRWRHERDAKLVNEYSKAKMATLGGPLQQQPELTSVKGGKDERT